MRIGLIGYPVAHSASPRMQGAAFAVAGLDWRYELWNTPLDELPARMRRIRDDDQIGGANVTVPHKQNVMPYLDAVSPQARAIGAVNTIIKTRTRGTDWTLSGDNTDWVGFLNDLRWHGVEPQRLAPAAALVLGAGGSARGIAYALANCGLAVNVLNRDPARADQLVESLRPGFPGVPLRAYRLSAESVAAVSPATSLIVNCTSAGMSPHADTTPWPEGAAFPNGAVLYDLVYKPAVTLLMRQAEQASLRVIGGMGMLAEQGAVAFELWTGVAAQRVAGVMRAALQSPA
ncbi:MAG: shikimate dehydrogenase [Chloroflexi bacterium]|nr:shikimate dehydrogenase [Chloroflexota bacterium]MCL5275295.1 shikimate dehydrogenase [Chloroflexota bacterium]